MRALLFLLVLPGLVFAADQLKKPGYTDCRAAGYTIEQCKTLFDPESRASVDKWDAMIKRDAEHQRRLVERLNSKK